jgi:hypothetical protein
MPQNTYSTLPGHKAQTHPALNGKTAVTLTSKSPLKIRQAHTGIANVGFTWVSSGKSTSWQFQPTLLNPKRAEYAEAVEDQKQTVTVELSEVQPSVGFVSPRLTGAFQTSAIHFDVPHAYDVWILLLQTAPSPPNLTLEKTQLAVCSGSAQSTAQLRTYLGSKGDALNAEVNAQQGGFRKTTLAVRRTLRGNSSGDTYSAEEALGEVKSAGTAFLTWKPKQKPISALWVTSYGIATPAFLEFLKFMGAEVAPGLHLSGVYLKSSLILCDGPPIRYAVQLTGEKRFVGRVQDENKLFLNC